MTRVITFSTNRTYQPYVLSLLHSLEPYYNEVIVCRCVNCDDTFVNLLKGKGVEVIIDNRVLNQRKRIKNIHESQVLIDGQKQRIPVIVVFIILIIFLSIIKIQLYLL